MELWRRVEKIRESYGGDEREQRLELWSKEQNGENGVAKVGGDVFCKP